jgi:hypothetical protein
MLQLEVLILELVTIDGLSSSSVMVGEVSSLTHELGNDAVESGSLVTESLFASAQSTEVFGGAGDHISAQLKKISSLNYVR